MTTSNHQNNGRLDQLVGEWHKFNECLNSKSYRQNKLYRLRRFIETQQVEKPEDINVERIQRHMIFLKGEGLEPGTIKSTINTVGNFCKFLVLRGLLPSNPVSLVEKPKPPTLPPRALNKEQAAQVLQIAREKGFFLEVLTALLTGMRVSEIRRLKWNDIDFDKNLIRVVRETKNDNPHVVPLHPQLKQELQKLKESGLVFPSKQGHHSNRYWSYLFDPVRKAMPQAFTEGWEGKRACRGWHVLRHTYASLLVQSGVSIYKISKWLGHKNVKQTERYATLNPQYDRDIEVLEI